MALHVFQNIKVNFSVIINMLLSNENPTGMLYFIKGLTECEPDIQAHFPEKLNS